MYCCLLFLNYQLCTVTTARHNCLLFSQLAAELFSFCTHSEETKLNAFFTSRLNDLTCLIGDFAEWLMSDIKL